MMNEKLLFAHLTAEQTYVEWGRIFYCVLHTFANSGYKISLLENDKTKTVDEYGKPAFDIKDLQIVRSIPDDYHNYSLLYDEKNNKLAGKPWKRQIHLKYDLYSPYWFEQPLVMPFPIHPLQYVYHTSSRFSKLRNTKKEYRVLFAGDVQGYKRNWVTYPKIKLSRQQILETLTEKFNDHIELISSEQRFQSIMNSDFTDKLVIIDNDTQRIENRLWFDVIAKGHFFLSPPGIVMPMCHNIIEAMAIGVIPITNYPEWFHPNLEHGRNCIVFDDKRDLLEKMKYIFSMDENHILEMKNNVIDFYEEHLEPGQFIRRVENVCTQHVTILYYTEANVAKNAKKLNRHSILMRDTTIPFNDKSLRYKAMRLLKRC